jgi:ABC-type glycerol-3-phosphate transport system permease component
MCFNSLTLVFAGGLVASIGPLVMGYMIAKFDNKFSKFLTFYIVFFMNFTVVGADPAAIRFRQIIGAYDNMLGHVLLQFGFTSINTLMYAGVFSGVSKEYADAATLDGAGEWTIMLRIMFPFAINLWGTYFVIRMIGVWNSYSDVLVLIPSYPTIAYGTYLMSVSKDTQLADVPHRISVAVLMVIPTTAVFVIFRNKFLNNVSIGGVKG